MVKGRNTVMVHIRLPDAVLAELKRRADKEGLPASVLARHYLEEKCGLPKT